MCMVEGEGSELRARRLRPIVHESELTLLKSPSARMSVTVGR